MTVALLSALTLVAVAGGGVFVGYKVGQFVEHGRAVTRTAKAVQVARDETRASVELATRSAILTGLFHCPTSLGGRAIARALGMDPGPLPRGKATPTPPTVERAD